MSFASTFHFCEHHNSVRLPADSGAVRFGLCKKRAMRRRFSLSSSPKCFDLNLFQGGFFPLIPDDSFSVILLHSGVCSPSCRVSCSPNLITVSGLERSLICVCRIYITLCKCISHHKLYFILLLLLLFSLLRFLEYFLYYLPLVSTFWPNCKGKKKTKLIVCVVDKPMDRERASERKKIYFMVF